MTDRRRLAAAGAACAASFLLFLLHAPVRSSAGWDDSYYLLQTSSLVEDGDVDLRNDILAAGIALPRRIDLLTRTTGEGRLDNQFSIGPAVLWLPAYAAGLPFRRTPPGSAPIRWGLVQRDALHLASLAMLCGILFFLLRLAALAAPDGRLQPLAAAALLLGTPLAVYATSDYTMSHLASALAAALLVTAALELDRAPAASTACLAGLAWGLTALVRWQDALLGILLLVPLSRVPWRRAAGLAIAIAAGFVPMAALQLVAWRVERGHWLVLPQGAGFFHAGSPALARFLLSGRSGLLPWSPVFLLAALGLALPWRLRLSRRWAFAALAVLAAEVYLNAAVRDWWGGHSFGARRMVSCVPLLPLGLANLGALARTRAPRRVLAALLAGCCLWGLFAAHVYWSGMQDLSVVFRGAPSEPGSPAIAAVGGIADPAVARARLRDVALEPPADYWAAAGRPGSAGGIVLTWLLVAAVAGLVAAALAVATARRWLEVLLVGLLAVAVAAGLRLAAGPHADAPESAGWERLAISWRQPPRRYDPAATLPPAEGDWRHSPFDAYRYVRLCLELEAGDPREARELLRGLLARGYPAAAEMRAALDRAVAGGEVLRFLPGPFFTPVRGRPALDVPLPAIPPGSRALEVRFEIRSDELADELAAGTPYDLLHLVDGDGRPLVGLGSQGAAELRLETPEGRASGLLRLAPGTRYGITVRCAESAVTLRAADLGGSIPGAGFGSAGSVLELAAPLRSPCRPTDLVFGRLRRSPDGGAAPRGIRFAELAVAASPG